MEQVAKIKTGSASWRIRCGYSRRTSMRYPMCYVLTQGSKMLKWHSSEKRKAEAEKCPLLGVKASFPESRVVADRKNRIHYREAA
jgi:hypothetical protein